MSNLLAQMSAPEWGGILLLLLWMLVTIIFQFTGTRIKAFIPWAILGLLPRWTFFAPHPGTSDYHLLYRDYLSDGTVLPWQEVPLLKAPQWWMVLWNPYMREAKVLFDVVQSFRKLASSYNGSIDPTNFSRLESSVPYLLLLQVVTNYPHKQTAHSVQFLIMQSPEGLFTSDPEVLLLSCLHPLLHSEQSKHLEEELSISWPQQ